MLARSLSAFCLKSISEDCELRQKVFNYPRNAGAAAPPPPPLISENLLFRRKTNGKFSRFFAGVAVTCRFSRLNLYNLNARNGKFEEN